MEMAKEGAEAATPPPSLSQKMGMSPIALMIPILNSVALLATLGVFYYSRIKFKRPAITEETEKLRLAIKRATTKEPVPALIDFEPVTVNIGSMPLKPHAADGTSQQIHGKLHYVTLSFALRIQDKSQQDMVEGARPAVMDHLIHLLGKKQFH